MSVSQTFTNTFIGGMAQDLDSKIQKNSTYRFAIGTRLMWNGVNDPDKTLEENVKSGVTLAICNVRGNRFEIAMCNGYKLTGHIVSPKGTLLLSTNGTNSEIGFFTINTNIDAANPSKYTTLYNDGNDPNGDKLNFSQKYYAHGFYVYESDFAERYYWTDGYNQKRVVNYSQFFNSMGVPYDNQLCDASSVYPKHMSGHAFDERMDLIFPRVMFDGRIKGSLKSGQYQVGMRYVSENGHTSVVSPLSRPVFLTAEKIDGDIIANGVPYPDAYQQNHHNRKMGASNIMTEEGMKWKFEGLDIRWDYFELIYVYSATSKAFQEATRYEKYKITSPQMVVELKGHTGHGLSIEDLNQRHETLMSVGTTAQQENRVWDGNIEMLPDYTAMDMSVATVKPIIKEFRADNTDAPLFTKKFNPVSSRYDNDPITNTFPESEYQIISNFTGNTTAHRIRDDYKSYKGQLFSQLYKGYFRGETQPFALVPIDRKGNPLFAIHMLDYTFPNMYETKDEAGNAVDWSLSRLNASDGKYNLRAMGAMFSNIKLPASLIYDKFGKLNLSGFMIVRTKRIKRNVAQGIMMNANQSVNEETNDGDDGFVHPKEFLDNKYDLKSVPGAILPDGHVYSSYAIGSNYNGGGPHSDKKFGFNASSFFNFYSPEIFIENKLPDETLAGRFKKVGFVHKSMSQEFVDIFSGHFYTKTYKTVPQSSTNFPDEAEKNQNGRARIGSTSRIKWAFMHNEGPLHIYPKFDPETSDKVDYRVQVQAFFPDSRTAWKATQEPKSVVTKLMDWTAIDSIESLTSKETHAIVNWEVNPDGYYTAENSSSLEKRVYFSTGHFQPLNPGIMDAVKKEFNDDGSVKNFVFDEVEVWGGDCYVNLFDFTHLYPEYSNCAKYDGQYPDYSSSIICPIESKYNLALMYGRRYAANCVRPQRTSCEGENDQLSNGICPQQPEDWAYNEVLLLEENAQFYYPKPANLKIIQSAPNQVRWSPKKIYGENEDSYRQNLPLDYGYVTGDHGKIQRFAQAFNYLYCVQESGFGLLQTNLRTMIPTDDGELSVSTGDVFGGVQYYSKEYGTQHPNSVWAIGNQIGFFDANRGKLLTFTQAGLSVSSEEKNVNDTIVAKSVFFDRTIEHAPEHGRFVDVIVGHDLENSHVITTFHHTLPTQVPGSPFDRINEMRSFSIQFNRNLAVYSEFQHFTPYYYFNTGRYLLAPHQDNLRQNELFLFNHGKYGQWYGQYYDSILEFIVNPQPNVDKVFDTGVFNVNLDGYRRIAQVLHTVEDNTHLVTQAEIVGGAINYPDERFRFEGGLFYPMHEIDWLGEKQRLRSRYLVVRITIDNSQQEIDGNDQLVALTSFDTKFRLSNPIQY